MKKIRAGAPKSARQPLIWKATMVKLADDAIFEQFIRPGKEDFAGMSKMIAKRLREGVDERGAKWLADLFDPAKGFAFQATISRRRGYPASRENERNANFDRFISAYYAENQDIDRAIKKIQEPESKNYRRN